MQAIVTYFLRNLRNQRVMKCRANNNCCVSLMTYRFSAHSCNWPPMLSSSELWQIRINLQIQPVPALPNATQARCSLGPSSYNSTTRWRPVTRLFSKEYFADLQKSLYFIRPLLFYKGVAYYTL